MNDEQRSGNRWEPTDPDQVRSSDLPSAGADTAELDRSEAAAPTGAASSRSWIDRVRPLRTRAAAVAAALFLLGGAGGFLLGHLTGADDGQTGQRGDLGPGPRRDGLGRGDGDGRGFGPQDGQQAPDQDGAQSGDGSSNTA